MDNKLYSKFFSDPDWALVEEMILKFIEPLKDSTTIDKTQPAEHVKAELIARELAYNALWDFLQTSHLVGRKPLKEKINFR